jgi:hypothetical protein
MDIQNSITDITNEFLILKIICGYPQISVTELLLSVNKFWISQISEFILKGLAILVRNFVTISN